MINTLIIFSVVLLMSSKTEMIKMCKRDDDVRYVGWCDGDRAAGGNWFTGVGYNIKLPPLFVPEVIRYCQKSILQQWQIVEIPSTIVTFDMIIAKLSLILCAITLSNRFPPSSPFPSLNYTKNRRQLVKSNPSFF